MTNAPVLSFDRGTLVLRGLIPAHNASPRESPRFLWDDRSSCLRAPALVYRDVIAAARADGVALVDQLAPTLGRRTGPWKVPPLRAYQDDALRAFRAYDRRGVISLPTGSGKTRVAVAALAEHGRTALILCPTRALLWGWRRELDLWYGGPVGVVGDGESSVQGVTLMTFESGYRHLDRLGDRFATVIVDEAHHFAGGLRAEALEMCPAPARLGLTATPPARGTAGAARLDELIGPLVCEVGVQELAGTHLAELEVVRLLVWLDPEERAEYERSYRPFAAMRAAFLRANPGSNWTACVRAMARTPGGRASISGFHRALAIASFNAGKGRLVAELLARHSADPTLVFTAYTRDAYAISAQNLIAAITAEIERAEREDVLRRFREGRLRAIVSARVLNEGIDVPHARVAIIAGGALGAREHTQRIGRVLRPGPDKRALLYELVTGDTLDDARARARWRPHAARESDLR
jgi:superfamily II DNA or RNA helicase